MIRQIVFGGVRDGKYVPAAVVARGYQFKIEECLLLRDAKSADRITPASLAINDAEFLALPRYGPSGAVSPKK